MKGRSVSKRRYMMREWKELVYVVFILAIAGVIINYLVEHPRTDLRAQGEFRVGTKYVHVDSFATTTSSTDTVFPVKWNKIRLKALSETTLVRIGGLSDTTSWSSRKFWRLDPGDEIELGPEYQVWRLEFLVTTGTGGLLMIGDKNSDQY